VLDDGSARRKRISNHYLPNNRCASASSVNGRFIVSDEVGRICKETVVGSRNVPTFVSRTYGNCVESRPVDWPRSELESYRIQSGTGDHSETRLSF
jgi:hypothetical protein